MKRAVAISLVAVAAVSVAAAIPRGPHPDALSIADKYLVPSYVGRYQPDGAFPGPPAWRQHASVHIAGDVAVEPPPGGGSEQANPAITAQYGLWAYGRYLRGHVGARSVVLHVADWLVRHQGPDGSWLYHFLDPYPGGNLVPPWPSAIAQGNAMSLLERAYRLTHRSVYLAAAVQALRPFQRAVSAGGLRRCFHGDCRLPFYEEAPTRDEPAYILNGFMFALVGLYDVSSVAPNSEAPQLYRAGRRTLDVALPSYDQGGLATYDLLQGYVSDAKYQAIQLYLMHALDTIEPDDRLEIYARRWRQHLREAPARDF